MENTYTRRSGATPTTATPASATPTTATASPTAVPVSPVRRIPFALAPVIALLAILALPGPARAMLERVHGHLLVTASVVHESAVHVHAARGHDSRGAERPRSLTGEAAAGADAPLSTANPPLYYHGGPVMNVERAHVVVWSPPGFSMAAQPLSVLVQYLSDLGATPSSADVFGVASQYHDAAGPAASSVSLADMQTDQSPYPASTCPVTEAQPMCITDAQLDAELTRLLGVGTQTPQDVYLVLIPASVRLCLTSSNCGGYCGYHSAVVHPNGASIVYAAIPEPSPAGESCELGGGPHDPVSDAEIQITTHEMIEAATDPLPGSGWMDSHGGEIADECAWENGPTRQLGESSSYNEILAGTPYLVPEMWSDDGETCAQGYQPSLGAAIATSTSSPEVGEQVSLQASAFDSAPAGESWSWNAAGPGEAAMSTQGTLATVSFSAPGVYTLWATMVDGAGNLTTAVIGMTVVEDPTAAISYTWSPRRSRTRPQAGYPIAFESSGSSSPNGSVASYRWSYGDGSSGTGASPTHTFAAAGYYRVTLEVTDAAGHAASVTSLLRVVKPPRLLLRAGGARRAGSPLTLTAVGHSPYGRIEGYAWSIDGRRARGTGNTLTHVFTRPGRYFVRVLMTDRYGQWAQASMSIRIGRARPSSSLLQRSL